MPGEQQQAGESSNLSTGNPNGDDDDDDDPFWQMPDSPLGHSSDEDNGDDEDNNDHNRSDRDGRPAHIYRCPNPSCGRTFDDFVAYLDHDSTRCTEHISPVSGLVDTSTLSANSHGATAGDNDADDDYDSDCVRDNVWCSRCKGQRNRDTFSYDQLQISNDDLRHCLNHTDEGSAASPELFAIEIRKMRDMGFSASEARDALDGAGGDVDRAINLLFWRQEQAEQEGRQELGARSGQEGSAAPTVGRGNAGARSAASAASVASAAHGSGVCAGNDAICILEDSDSYDSSDGSTYAKKKSASGSGVKDGSSSGVCASNDAIQILDDSDSYDSSDGSTCGKKKSASRSGVKVGSIHSSSKSSGGTGAGSINAIKRPSAVKRKASPSKGHGGKSSCRSGSSLSKPAAKPKNQIKWEMNFEKWSESVALYGAYVLPSYDLSYQWFARQQRILLQYEENNLTDDVWDKEHSSKGCSSANMKRLAETTKLYPKKLIPDRPVVQNQRGLSSSSPPYRSVPSWKLGHLKSTSLYDKAIIARCGDDNKELCCALLRRAENRRRIGVRKRNNNHLLVAHSWYQISIRISCSSSVIASAEDASKALTGVGKPGTKLYTDLEVYFKTPPPRYFLDDECHFG